MVSSPTHSHEALVRQALTAGKHVLCEKPLSMSTSGTAELFALAHEADRRLLVGFQRRFDPTLAEMHPQLEERAVGQLQFLRSTSRDSPVPSLDYLKISGGLLHDCVVHDVDMLLWLAATQDLAPVEVYAQASCFREDIAALPDIDTAAVQLRFDNGAIAAIDVSRASAARTLGPQGGR